MTCIIHFWGNDMVLSVFSGYDGQGDWNAYSRYMNLDGGMAQVRTLFSSFQTCDDCVFLSCH